MADPKLTTTQSFWGSPNPDGSNVQFLTGTLNVLDITLKNGAADDHKRWPGQVLGTGGVLQGVEYTVTEVAAADKNTAGLVDIGGDDFSAVRSINGMDKAYKDLEAGYKFIASKTKANIGLAAGTKLGFSSIGEAIGLIYKLLAQRATIVAVGKVIPIAGSGTAFTVSFPRWDKADDTLAIQSGDGGANKFAVILENSRYEHLPSARLQDKDKLLYYLNTGWNQLNAGSTGFTPLALDATTVFEVGINPSFGE